MSPESRPHVSCLCVAVGCVGWCLVLVCAAVCVAGPKDSSDSNAPSVRSLFARYCVVCYQCVCVVVQGGPIPLAGGAFYADRPSPTTWGLPAPGRPDSHTLRRCGGRGGQRRFPSGSPALGSTGWTGGRHPLAVSGHTPQGGGGGWHKASVSDCLPLAAPIGLSPPLILTLRGPERVLVVSTDPPDDLSCLTTPGVGSPGDGAVARAVDQVHPDAPSESVGGFADSSTDLCALGCASAG